VLVSIAFPTSGEGADSGEFDRLEAARERQVV